MGRAAGFTAFAILIAGLGIGASSTVFSVVNALLLRPLPFRDSGRLVWISNANDDATQPEHYSDLRLRNHEDVSFVVPENKPDPIDSSATAQQRNATSLSQASEPNLTAEQVFDRFNDVLQIAPSEVDTDPVKFFISRLKNVLPGFTDFHVESISTAVKKLREGHERLDTIKKKMAERNYREAVQLSCTLSSEIGGRFSDAILAQELMEGQLESRGRVAQRCAKRFMCLRLDREIGRVAWIGWSHRRVCSEHDR